MGAVMAQEFGNVGDGADIWGGIFGSIFVFHLSYAPILQSSGQQHQSTNAEDSNGDENAEDHDEL